jgi:hypothetical protein
VAKASLLLFIVVVAAVLVDMPELVATQAVVSQVQVQVQVVVLLLYMARVAVVLAYTDKVLTELLHQVPVRWQW